MRRKQITPFSVRLTPALDRKLTKVAKILDATKCAIFREALGEYVESVLAPSAPKGKDNASQD